MKKKRLKAGEFTEEEMQFLLKNVERENFIIEKERIELQSAYTTTVQKLINGEYYNYQSKTKDKKTVEQKEKIMKAILEADDFAIEYYGDCDDDCSGVCTLITYNLTLEPQNIYMKRLKSEGRQIINSEKAKAARKAKEETRKVLFEKVIKKKRRVSVPTIPVYERRARNIRYRGFGDLFHPGA